METKKCPFCGEEIKSVAIKCKHCGEFLNQTGKEEENTPNASLTDISEPADKDKVKKWYNKLWLVSILCIIFFPIGIYGFWKGSSLKNGWKVLISILIFQLVLYIFQLCISGVTKLYYSNKGEDKTYLLLEDTNSEETINPKSIKFTIQTSQDNEDFNTFINNFMADTIFQVSRVSFPLKDFNGKQYNDWTERNYTSFKDDEIFEGRKEFKELATPVDAVFEKTNDSEVKYTYTQDGTCNMWSLIFEIKDNKWYLTQYQNYTE